MMHRIPFHPDYEAWTQLPDKNKTICKSYKVEYGYGQVTFVNKLSSNSQNHVKLYNVLFWVDNLKQLRFIPKLSIPYRDVPFWQENGIPNSMFHLGRNTVLIRLFRTVPGCLGNFPDSVPYMTHDGQLRRTPLKVVREREIYGMFVKYKPGIRLSSFTNSIFIRQSKTSDLIVFSYVMDGGQGFPKLRDMHFSRGYW